MGETKRVYSCPPAMSAKLGSFIDNPELADVRIKIGHRLYFAHRVVLGAWSGQLARMMGESRSDIIELSSAATEKEIDVFGQVLRFLYTGEMTFTADSVKMVMSLAQRFGLGKLLEMAQDWIGDVISYGNVVSAITWLRDAEEGDFQSLKNRCLKTLALYFEYIPETTWLALSKEELVSILDQDDIVAENEDVVIERVDKWLLARGAVDDNRDLYQEVGRKIRYPFIEITQLVNLQESSPIVRYATEFHPKLVSEAFRFRAISSELSATDPSNECVEDMGDRIKAGSASLKQSNVNPRLYLKFVSPGNVGDRQHRYSENLTGFRQLSFNSYHNNMTCVVRESNGSWKSKRSLNCKLVPKLESHQEQNAEVWSVKYEVTSDNSLINSSSYKIVVVTMPIDNEAEFYLHENPIVMTCEGFIAKLRESRPGQSVIVMSTPPIFAGKKPSNVKVAAVAYFLNESYMLSTPVYFD